MKAPFAAGLTIAAAAILGGLIGPAMENASAAAEDLSGLAESVKRFAKVYAAVEREFADPLQSETAVYEGAIPGMLRHLDPHSNFVPPREWREMQQKQQGQYYGVGMEVTVDGDYVVVANPFPNSPAARAGLRRGDAILQVDNTDCKGFDTPKVAELLKGPKGTPVSVRVRREGSAEPVKFDLRRGEISPTTVNSCWVKQGVGYVRITTFESQTVGREVREALDGLGRDSLKGLVLDLRGNGGGLVSEAVNVADNFLRKGQAIVSQNGRSEPKRQFVAKNGSTGPQYPIVVLVDRGTASASEIVSGALQDHDRAWILGETTFGKGLVQAQFPISGDAALLLTIAHYYTPSGRLIQRDYSDGSFFDYYYRRKAEARNNSDVRMTDSGRTVYGGGGITPDEKYTRPNVTVFQARAARSGAFFHYGSHYFGTRPLELPRNWAPDEATFADFRAFLRKDGIPFTDADFELNKEWISHQLRLELHMRVFGRIQAEQWGAERDEEVKHAVSSMPKATALFTEANRKLAARMPGQKVE
jgi:carboxyl-terminal processing protease